MQSSLPAHRGNHAGATNTSTPVKSSPTLKNQLLDSDIAALSIYHDASLRGEVQLSSETCQQLMEENAELGRRLTNSRRQILQAAMDIRGLGAHHEQSRQENTEIIRELRAENDRLRALLAADGRSNSRSSSSPVPQVLASSFYSMPENVEATKAEVSRLREKMAMQQRQLEALLDYVRRADHSLEDTTFYIASAQALTRDEASRKRWSLPPHNRPSESSDDVMSTLAAIMARVAPARQGLRSAYNTP